MTTASQRHAEYAYIVVGSGAGGGSVAAKLAQAGHTVLVLEAGGDPMDLAAPRLPEDYQVPVFHAFASENEAMKWDFFVRHYAQDGQQQRDQNFLAQHGGVLYPRAGALGSCTAHNAMIRLYPHNADWDDIAERTGDPSWKAEHMRQYFQRLENCQHRPVYRWLHKLLGVNSARHGLQGWLTTEKALPLTVLGDRTLMEVIFASALGVLAKSQYPL